MSDRLKLDFFENLKKEVSGFYTCERDSETVHFYETTHSNYCFSATLSNARVTFKFIKEKFEFEVWIKLLGVIEDYERLSLFHNIELSFWKENRSIKDHQFIEADNIFLSSSLIDIRNQVVLLESIRAGLNCIENLMYYVEDSSTGLSGDCVKEESDLEGGRKLLVASRVERSRFNRNLAIRIHGNNCMVCGFNFGNFYGKVGDGFIEIHHLEKISTGGRRRINPQTDLLPVCSNCHSMLHRKDPPILPDYLSTLISKADE